MLPHLLRSRMGRVCVALTGSNATEMLSRAVEAARENPFLEFRLDTAEKPLSIVNKLKAFLESYPLVTAIATCRRKPNGGQFSGSVAEEIDILTAAAKAGCHIIDVEIETAQTLKSGVLDRLRDAGASVLISFHDFQGTPDLQTVYDRMQRLAPDFYKIVPTAKTLSDNLKLLDLLSSRAEDANLIGVAMGTPGILSRVLAPRFGSLFTFASATAGEETAPGQIASRTMHELYRIDAIEASTRIYGVAGSPITSSRSPLMINTAFRRETVNAVYLALECSDVKDLARVIDRLPIHGLSITMPLKEEILPLLERTDPLSAKIGACNTLVRAQDGKLYGFNTDVAGIVGPLERRISLRGAKILVLGAGGVARAAVFGLKDKGADVSILNRTPEKAQKLARQSGAKVMRRDQMAKTHFDVIINATPFGMLGQKIASPIAANELNCKLFFDLVYNPIDTPLVRLARTKGIPVILGIEMFVTQGARQFEIWTGKPAPQDEMLRVVLHALKQQSENASVQASNPIPESTPATTEKPASAPPMPVAAKAVPSAKPVAAAKPVTAKKSVPVKASVAASPQKSVAANKKPAPAVKKTIPAVKAAATPKKTAARPATAKKAATRQAANKKASAKPAARPAAKSLAKPAPKPAAKPASKTAAQRPKPSAAARKAVQKRSR